MSYYETLEALSKGWNEQSRWVSTRASGSWYQVVSGILGVLETSVFQDRLHFTKPLKPVALEEGVPEWAQGEMELLELAFDFAECLAENVLWSNARYWWSIPELLATLLHSERGVRKAGMQQMKTIVEAVLAADRKSVV